MRDFVYELWIDIFQGNEQNREHGDAAASWGGGGGESFGAMEHQQLSDSRWS